MTKQAYLDVFGKSITAKTWEHPLLAGVEWNDDPDQLIRKVLWAGFLPGTTAIQQIMEFVHRLKSKTPKYSLTVRSHLGDLQFCIP